MPTYDLQRTKIKVNRATWTRVLLDLFRRDTEIASLQYQLFIAKTDRNSEHIRDAEFAGWSQCVEEMRIAMLGYPDMGGDTETMQAVDRHVKSARAQGREDVLKILREFGYSEPPRLSGRGLAAMLENRLRREDGIRAAGATPY